MTLHSLVNRLHDGLRAFRTAQGGNVVFTFALVMIPMIGLVGAAVDYSRGNSAKAAMQAAVDSTALMLSKEALSLNSAQLNARAMDVFTALFNRTDVFNISIKPVFTSPEQGSFRIDVAGTGEVATTFTKLLGHHKLKVNVTSEVLWGMKKLELALALDNTGSMASSGKMGNLKTAAHTLLDVLKKASKKDGDVKVAIIPFDTTVNIGKSYQNRDWFDIESIDCNGWKKGNGCNKTNWRENWEGCVRDRAQPYDVLDTSPTTADTKTLYPVYDCGDIAEALPLTSKWEKLNNKIDDMNPNGMTNVTIGLVWAWHALTPNQPYTKAAEPAPDLDKVIIILTDGDNTEAWDNINNKKITTPSAIDARTAAVCANIKAANIKIYAVRVIDGNAELLRNCATSPSMYFDVQQASQLNDVFTAIAQNLANLRIAK